MSRKLQGRNPFMLSVFFAAVIPPHFIADAINCFFTYFCWRKNPPRKVPVKAFFADFVGKLTIFNGIWSNRR